MPDPSTRSITRQEIADVYEAPVWLVDLERPMPPRGLRWTWRVGLWWRRSRFRLSVVYLASRAQRAGRDARQRR